MDYQTQAALQRVMQKVRQVLRPPPKLSVHQWADERLALSPEDSAEPGRYRSDRAPYQRGIMDAFSDPKVETVVVMSSAQIGKTLILKAILGYHVDQDPAPILVLQPTLEMAETFSKDRLAPMVRDTLSLRGKIADAKSRDSGNTLLHKRFPGGHITLAGANSPASLASRPIRVVLCDEVDRYPASAGTEGDPVKLAIKRTTTFWNRKIGLVSTPTVKDSSRIEMAWNESDQRRYYVPCPHCEAFQVLRWANVRWPDGEPHQAYYVCPDCGGVIRDHHKMAMLTRGEWRAESESTKIAGFHISELYSPWRRFGDVAADFISAKATPDTLKVWVNTSLGETWEEDASAKLGASDLASRAEFYPAGTAPEGVLTVVAGVDTQDNRLAVSLWGFGRDEEAWLISHQEIFGDPAQPAVWAQLDEAVLRSVPHALGGSLPVSAVAIDSGGHYTAEVYAYARDRRAQHVFAVKGQSQRGKPPIGKPVKVDLNWRGRLHKAGAEVYPVGSDTIKTTLYARLKLNEPGPGYLHFHGEATDDYFAQLTAEKQVTRHVKGFPVRDWVKKSGARNEALDCLVYAYAAMQWLYTRHNRRTIWDQFERALDIPTGKKIADKSQDKGTDSHNSTAKNRIKRGNFVTAW